MISDYELGQELKRVDSREFSKRLNEALDFRNVPPINRKRSFCVALDIEVSHKAVRYWLRGDAKPALRNFKKLFYFYQIEPYWLMYGTGEMVPSREIPCPPAFKEGTVIGVY